MFLSIAIEADQNSFQHYKSGVFEGPCGINLDHGVLLVGYTKDTWIVKNSWGPTVRTTIFKRLFFFRC